MNEDTVTIKVSEKEKMALVKKYLDTGKVETKDSLALGIDPWKYPNFGELYVKRLAVIVEELIIDRF